MTAEQEWQVVEMLAHIYNAVPWSKMRTSKNPHDVFNHRVRAAARRGTLYEALSKLANYFGLQSLPAAVVEAAQRLRPVEQRVLDAMYCEHVMVSMLAILRAKELREEARQRKTEGGDAR